MTRSIDATALARALMVAAEAIEGAAHDLAELGGAPAGQLYAVMSAEGMSLSTFEAIVAALVAAGRIRREGDRLLPA